MAGRIKGKKYKSRNYPYPLTSLQKINLGRKWKVRARLNDSGYWTLYLHLQQYKNGKRKSLYKTPPWPAVIHSNTNTRNQDKYVLDRVVEWRNKLELQFMDRSLGLDTSKDANKILFKDYYQKIMQSKKLEITKNTLCVFKNFINHWDVFINGNDYLLGEISLTVVKDFKDHLLKYVSPNSADIYLTKFKFILNNAVNDEILVRNPTEKVKIKTQNKPKRFLTAEELIRLEKEFKADNTSAAAFLFSVYTGARFSDINALKYDDIHSVITEGNEVVYVWDLHVKKTGTSQRIFLLNEALNIINLIREQHRGEVIFPLPTPPIISKYLRRWAKEAGVRDFTFHTARHTWASLNAAVNPMLYLKEGLGHSSIATTQIYSHLQPGQKIQSVKKFSDYLSQARRVYEERQKPGN